jgi:hypothetical protein
MGSSVIPAPSSVTLPAGATANVASGYVSKGWHSLSLSAGNYAISIYQGGPDVYGSIFGYDNAIDNVFVPTDGTPTYFTLSTTETSFTIGTGWSDGTGYIKFSAGVTASKNYTVLADSTNTFFYYLFSNNSGTFNMYRDSKLNSHYLGSVLSTPAVTTSGGQHQGNKMAAYGGASNNILIWNAGDASVLRSTNGTTWTTHTNSMSAQGRGIIYGSANNYWVMFSANATNTTSICSSTDGITWTNRTSATDANQVLDIAYGGGNYVAACGGSRIASSTDSITWAARTYTGASSLTSLNNVAYGNGIFLIAGNNDAGTQGNRTATMLYSTNGTTWTATTPAYNTIASPSFATSSLTFYNGYFYALDDGMIPATGNTMDPRTQKMWVSSNATTWVAYSFNPLVFKRATTANPSVLNPTRYVQTVGNQGVVVTSDASTASDGKVVQVLQEPLAFDLYSVGTSL